MENASKALGIAGGVLIAIMILTIGVSLIGEFDKTADSYVTTLDGVELHKYNTVFEVFIGRTDITAQEIVSVIGIAKQKEQGTRVWIGGADVTDYTEADKNALLAGNILVYKPNATNYDVENTYSYVSIGYDSDGKVVELKFKKN